jgi:hypothetical protein
VSWGVLGVVYQNIFCSLNFFWNDVDWNAGEDDRAEVAHRVSVLGLVLLVILC